MIYCDAHCHYLDQSEFDLANLAGVKNCIVNATHPDNWEKVLALKNIIPAIGVHPWFVENLSPTWEQNLEKYLIQNPALHIGEIGLDKCKNNFYDQVAVFEKQLELAQKYHRTVHVHNVRAWGEMLPIIKQYPNLTYLFHQFNGDKNVIRFFQDKRAFFSVHGANKIPLIPHDKLLVESDAPDALPSPTNIPFLYLELRLNPEQIQHNFESLIDGK